MKTIDLEGLLAGTSRKRSTTGCCDAKRERDIRRRPSAPSNGNCRYGDAYEFKIPLAKYEAYKRETDARSAEPELYFVSSEHGKIYAANTRILDQGYREGGFEFPVTLEPKDNASEICFFLDQFTYKWDIHSRRPCGVAGD